jgi:thioredoxin-related protein
MLFSPDCSHCQHTAEELIKYKDEIKDFQIIMTTLHPLWQMNAFVEKYHLKELENVVIGKDMFYIMPSFYNVKNLPFLAFYNKKGNLVTTFEGSMPLQRIIEVFKQNK